MSNTELRHRLSHFYALLTGVIGLFILAQLFAHQTSSIDLATLLAFTLMALIASYFRIPVGQGDLALDGAVLLGATMVDGVALGGWASFITGLVTGIMSLSAKPASASRWADSASAALLNSGRNVIAMAASWWCYQGLKGSAVPVAIDTAQALAIVILCITYAAVRHLWGWPVLALQSQTPIRKLSDQIHLDDFLIELAPLPIALLTAATFVKLGWSFFLLLAFVFAGLGAIMRQMLETMRAMQHRITALKITNQILEAIADTPEESDALGALAHELCKQIVRAPKVEIGLYNHEHTHVDIRVSVDCEARMPVMHIPLTPMWEWLNERQEPDLVQSKEQLDRLLFLLPPISKDRTPQTAMFVPILSSVQEQGKDTPTAPRPAIGGIVLQSPDPDAFTSQDMTHIVAVADQIGTAISRAQVPEKLVPS